MNVCMREDRLNMRVFSHWLILIQISNEVKYFEKFFLGFKMLKHTQNVDKVWNILKFELSL